MPVILAPVKPLASKKDIQMATVMGGTSDQIAKMRENEENKE